MRKQNFRAAIFRHYGGDWNALTAELGKLAIACGTTPESISMFMKGFDRSLPAKRRVQLCLHLGLNPLHYSGLGQPFGTSTTSRMPFLKKNVEKISFKEYDHSGEPNKWVPLILAIVSLLIAGLLLIIWR